MCFKIFKIQQLVNYGFYLQLSSTEGLQTCVYSFPHYDKVFRSFPLEYKNYLQLFEMQLFSRLTCEFDLGLSFWAWHLNI